MTDSEVAMHVAAALETTKLLKNPIGRAALKLGWTKRQLKQWRETHHEILAIAMEAYRVQQAAKDATPPTENEVFIPNPKSELNEQGASPETVALQIQRDNARIKAGLLAMNFSEQEAAEAMALEQFNKEHFTSVLDISTANLMRTNVRLGLEQSKIMNRLALIRDKIATFNGDSSDERDKWVAEEALQLKYLMECAEVISGIYEKTTRGQAQLALIMSRARMTPGNTKRVSEWKPGFSATIDVAKS